VLDVVFFGTLMKHATGLETFDEEPPAAVLLLKAYHDFKLTMIEGNIWGAFAAIGFTYHIKQNPYRLLFDEEKLRPFAAPSKPSFFEFNDWWHIFVFAHQRDIK
jgi:hypothetical protein